MIVFCGSIVIPVEAAENRGLCEYYGFTREQYLVYLESHENDNYYIGTPYKSGNNVTPNGKAQNGKGAMNCSGFIYDVISTLITKNGGKPGNYDIFRYSSPKNWKKICNDNNIQTYTYYSVSAALSSGKLEKGDILALYTNTNYSSSNYNHIGIYWGNGTTNRFWHSGSSGNEISEIKSVGTIKMVMIIKMTTKIPQKGDVNLDGKLSVEDARLLLRYCADLQTLNSRQLAVCDVNGDSKIKSNDVHCILSSL